MKKFTTIGQYPVDNEATQFMQRSEILVSDMVKKRFSDAITHRAGVTNLDGLLDGASNEGILDGVRNYEMRTILKRDKFTVLVGGEYIDIPMITVPSAETPSIIKHYAKVDGGTI